MKVNNKRQADNEPQPSPPKKRQAVAPTTRITRSSYKLKGDAAELNPGLPMASRQRKKPAPAASAPQDRKPMKVVSPPNDSFVEPAILPATTTYVPVAHEPAEQASAKPPSVIYAMGTTPGGRVIRAPILIGNDCRADGCQSDVVVAVNSTEAANPGGPAPIAYMGNEVAIAFTYFADASLHEVDQKDRMLKLRCRAPSRSSQISRTPSGPVQTCSNPSRSSAGGPASPATLTSATVMRTVSPVTKLKLDWSKLDPNWLKEGDEVWKAPQSKTMPAVVEASYSVSSFEQAAELLENEMDVQAIEEEVLALPVVEILVSDCPQDVVDGDSNVSSKITDSNPVIVKCSASASSLNTMDRTTNEETTKAACSPKAVDAFCRSNAPSPSFASHAADVSRLPKTPVKTAQQTANLQREKELRAKLIEMRRARLAVGPSCVQNVLVRSIDGSKSAITTQSTHEANCVREEDQYSVEEYEEDIVCY
ncbi:hypothetical protein N0V82_007153 [Gnomoniopsis sp. IMI 355080]|nr:hypothetical protein N0V82_007153 [Gnomoniopsis sp. IMI 355080]